MFEYLLQTYCSRKGHWVNSMYYPTLEAAEGGGKSCKSLWRVLRVVSVC